MLLHSISLIAGLQPLRLIAAFCIYSVIGWCMESAYMSFCNRKLTNRGFMTGPFCPIYGFGALAGFFLLKGFAENLLLLYVAGAVSATIFEYLVGRLMLKLSGGVIMKSPLIIRGLSVWKAQSRGGFMRLSSSVFYMES